MSAQMLYQEVRMLICIPTAGLVRAQTMFDMTMVMEIMRGKGALWPEAKRQGVSLTIEESSQIAANRERMVNRALDMDATHVLFIDDDMTFAPDAFVSLAKRHTPIVGVNYRQRFPPHEFTVVTGDAHPCRVITNAQSHGIEPVTYMGFGLCLIETQVFRALERPWFPVSYAGGTYTTEDVHFFQAAAKAGFTPYCDHDASKHVGHIGATTFRWSQDFEALAAKQEQEAA